MAIRFGIAVFHVRQCGCGCGCNDMRCVATITTSIDGPVTIPIPKITKSHPVGGHRCCRYGSFWVVATAIHIQWGCRSHITMLLSNARVHHSNIIVGQCRSLVRRWPLRSVDTRNIAVRVNMITGRHGATFVWLLFLVGRYRYINESTTHTNLCNDVPNWVKVKDGVGRQWQVKRCLCDLTTTGIPKNKGRCDACTLLVYSVWNTKIKVNFSLFSFSLHLTEKVCGGKGGVSSWCCKLQRYNGRKWTYVKTEKVFGLVPDTGGSLSCDLRFRRKDIRQRRTGFNMHQKHMVTARRLGGRHIVRSR